MAICFASVEVFMEVFACPLPVAQVDPLLLGFKSSLHIWILQLTIPYRGLNL